jgi:uncharacterized membrane protein YkvI
MLRTIKLSFIYLSGVIGAGFITGREIYSYFGRFGFWGFLGALVSMLLFFVTAVKLSRIIINEDCRDLKAVSKAIFGENRGAVVCLLTAVFLYCMYVVMLAGASELLRDYLNFGKWSAAVSVTCFCIVLLFAGFSGLATVCSVAAPVTAVIMLLTLALSGSYKSFFSRLVVSGDVGKFDFLCIGAAVVYCGYNLLVLLSVMPRASKNTDTYKDLKRGNVGGVFLVGGLIFAVLTGIYDMEGRNTSMPLLYKATEYNGVLRILMLLAVFITMILSCAVNLSNCGRELSLKLGCSEKTAGIILALAGCLLSFIGFGRLMDILYTFFGALGVILIIPLVFRRK